MAAVAFQDVTPAHNLSKSARAEAGGKIHDTADSLLTIPRGDVIATLNFYKAPEDGSVPLYVDTPPEGQPQTNYGQVPTSITIHDIRGHEDEYGLDNDAFQVIRNVPDSAEKDFTSDESIQQNYYPEVEKLILESIPGSNRVFIFEHTLRRPNRSGVLLTAHIDQTAKAAKVRVKRHLGADAETLLQGRYRIINVWRPLNGPLVSFPLAFASSASVEDADLIPIEFRYPDRSGETAGVAYNPGQKWHYLSGMQNGERLLLECFDSEALKVGSVPVVRGGRVPHSAFEDPRTPVDAPRRESIEIRALSYRHFGQTKRNTFRQWDTLIDCRSATIHLARLPKYSFLSNEQNTKVYE